MTTSPDNALPDDGTSRVAELPRPEILPVVNVGILAASNTPELIFEAARSGTRATSKMPEIMFPAEWLWLVAGTPRFDLADAASTSLRLLAGRRGSDPGVAAMICPVAFVVIEAG